MVKVYTKSGDKGETSLVDGKRVSKDHIRLEAYGTVDELNSIIGQVTCYSLNEQNPVLQTIQNKLFNIGSNLAAEDDATREMLPELKTEDIVQLEKEIDRMDEVLSPLKTFVLPGGNLCNASCHLARTVCRRAERRVVGIGDDNATISMIIQYLNRLSDYFFVLSRYALHLEGLPDREWKK
jgi:cob(I)alamin adenosyltransferase